MERRRRIAFVVILVGVSAKHRTRQQHTRPRTPVGEAALPVESVLAVVQPLHDVGPAAQRILCALSLATPFHRRCLTSLMHLVVSSCPLVIDTRAQLRGENPKGALRTWIEHLDTHGFAIVEGLQGGIKVRCFCVL